MAVNGNVIRTITIMGKAEGLDKLTADINKLAAAETNVAVVSEQSAKGMLSLEQSMAKLERRFVEGVRQQQDYERIQKELNRAVAQNPALQERAAAVLAAVNEKYNQGTAAQKAFAAATSGVSAQLIALSAGAGPVGTFLSALGPWGIAASVGIGAVAAVFNRLDEGAKRIGDKSIEMKKFSDVTGLSVTEIKGLTKAGAELGVSSEDITTSVERFSVGLFEARKGSGALFDQVNKINPALARQLAEATSTAQGWDVLAQAIKGATDAAQRNALARAAFGRGGIETGLVAAATVDKGGVAAMGEQIAKNTGLTTEWVNETARLRKENVELEKATQAAMDAAFALPVLQRQNEYLKTLKEIADLMIKGGGFKAPGAEDFGAPFANYLSPPVAPLSQRGPSEGAMQAQQEAAAQREVTKAIEDANKAREDAVSVEKMLVTIAQDTAEAEKRKAAVFAQNAAAYQNVSATTAQTLAQMKDQLAVASAVGGAARIEAQHRATINSLLTQGKSQTDAIAIADAQRAIAQAAINSAAKEHLATLRDHQAVASAIGGHAKIQAEAQATYNSLIRQGVDASIAMATAQQQAKNAYEALNAAAKEQTISLQFQLPVAQAITGAAQIQAQYEATINQLLHNGVDASVAIAQATAQRAVSLAQVNAEADRTLKSLQQEGELIRASSDAERDRIKARQTYQNLIDKGVDSDKARAVASKQLSNAEEQRAKAEREASEKAIAGIKSRADAWAAYSQGVISWSVANDEAGKVRRREEEQAWAIVQQQMIEAEQRFNAMYEKFKNLPFFLMDSLYALESSALFTSKQGGASQFNPAGYTSQLPQTQQAIFTAGMRYGEGGYERDTSKTTPFTSQFLNLIPNAQGLEKVVNDAMAGGVTNAIGGIISGLSSANASLVQSTAGVLSRLTNLLPDEQKAGAIQQQLGVLQGAPATLARDELIKQLNDQLKQLTEATNENTSATSAMTDVLSPFYSSDPRSTHLGFRAFAGGGIMSQYGELPIRHYQGGGMATSPQVAVYGEGSVPEAYVPVPSGRIPVELKTPANSNKQRPVVVNINVMGNADSGTVQALKSTAFQQAQAMRRMMG